MNDNPNQYKLNKRINDPVLLWIFPVMHVLPVFFAAGASVVLGNSLFFMTLGIAWYFLISYIDARYPSGYLLHKVWAMGLTKGLTKETKVVPDPMKSEYFQ